ncbi:MAG TPA: cobalamin-binding protein [Polyangiaceae bacterium]
MNRPTRRVVSLLASGTELVCALGAGERLVGRSHECDFPDWVKRLPVVSRPTFAIDGSSREIDELVRERLSAQKPLYEIDEALLARLAPDVVITQTHCEVCAVSPADLAHGGQATLAREQVVALSAGTLDAILTGFADVARVLDLAAEGARLVSAIRDRLSALSLKTKTLPRPRIACLEWLDPLFAMGNWGPELVELAGGENLLGSAGQHSTTTAFEAVRTADPELIVLAPCGFGIGRTWSELGVLAAYPGWSELRAVKNGRVFVADGNLYFNRSSPSLFETPEILAELIHPEHFPPVHEGRAWRRVPRP